MRQYFRVHGSGIRYTKDLTFRIWNVTPTGWGGPDTFEIQGYIVKIPKNLCVFEVARVYG